MISCDALSPQEAISMLAESSSSASGAGFEDFLYNVGQAADTLVADQLTGVRSDTLAGDWVTPFHTCRSSPASG